MQSFWDARHIFLFKSLAASPYCSGCLSESIVEYLQKWLKWAIQLTNPRTSKSKILTGSRWHTMLSDLLAESNFGIICLTKDNIDEPWIHFEAGAISKIVGKSIVCPYLIGLKESDVPVKGPLHQFQMVNADKEGTYQLVNCLNAEVESNRLTEDDLNIVFEKWWPELEAHLAKHLEYM